MGHLIPVELAASGDSDVTRAGGLTAMLISDPEQVERIRAERRESGHDWRDEVWDGVYVMSPSPNVDHQIIADMFNVIFYLVVTVPGLGRQISTINVSDRGKGWTENFREPDLSVYLNGNPAKNHGTHWEGGGDFVVEILSPGDLARHKRDFYAKVGVREFLVVDRYPWALELYRARDGRLELVGKSMPEGSEELTSEVLPLSFRLIPGQERPRIEVARRDVAESWTI